MSELSFPVVLLDSTLRLSLIIGLSVGVPVLLTGAVLLGILISHKRYAKLSASIRNKYSDYHSQLTTDCLGMIHRLQALGQYNGEFQASYIERDKQYHDIVNKRDLNMLRSIENLEDMLRSKKYKEAKIVYRQCVSDMNEFSRSVSVFNEDLNSLLRADNDTREDSLPAKEKYRHIKEYYGKYSKELKRLEKPFGIIFEKADSTFAKYNDLTDKAQFKEAKELLPELEKLLSAVEAVLPDLTTYESLSTAVIPAKLNTLTQNYQQLLSEGFVLDYLEVPTCVAEMKSELNDIQDQLNYLDVTGLKEKLDGIQTRITDILVKFDSEKKAKENFLKNQAIIGASNFEIEKEYSHIKNQIPDYQKTFVLNMKYVDQMYKLKNDIEVIGILKRELDSYLDANEKQPYTVIYSRMQRMQSEIDKVKQVTQDYSAYLETLKNDAQDVYMGLRDYYFSLKKAEYIVRVIIAVSSVTEAYDSRFKELYDKIAVIDHILVTRPVDVNKAKGEFEPFKNKCNDLIQDIQKKADECKSAEQAVVYANVFRPDFVDSRNDLTIAENAFAEGDFGRCRQQALKVVKEFKAALQESNAANVR